MKTLQLHITLLAIMMLLPNLSVASEPDWSIYSKLLQSNIQREKVHGMSINSLNYQALKGDKNWPVVLATLAQFSPNTLQTKPERIAFWINAYNILAIDMILRHWPIQSIRDAGSFLSPVWKHDAGLINGKLYSLSQIEHEILRPMEDPRIHVAIVCASVSCPDISPTPYQAKQLNAQLDSQATAFLSHTGKGVQVLDNKLRISKIFDWFEDDFQTYGGVSAFIRHYRHDIDPNMPIRGYLDYNWSLNATVINPIL